MGLVVCAWCGRILGRKAGVEGTSHGICPACKEKMESQLEALSLRAAEAQGVRPKAQGGNHAGTGIG